ncbi:hypothetical protein F2Q70_00043191 [Brassica cretica]|uniref:Uncharacterized protein n=1 Tax=Brassica cretica TaxID=69181 RepID=A0A8S9KL32_BRACR|nr:hypothetical protein F2Q70_00043191 [Brassica cretica]
MPSSSNKESQLIFSLDPASLERTIRKEARSLSTDNNTSASLDSAQPPSTEKPVPSTDSRSPLSIDNIDLPSTNNLHPTSIDIPSRTSIDTEPRAMVVTLILVRENNGDLHDQVGYLRNAAAKDEYRVYRDDREFSRDLDGHTIPVHNKDIRRLLERASRDEPAYVCLPEHDSQFTQTKLIPEIYTKDEISELFYGVCGEHDRNKEAFQMKLDGVYYPLNDSIS